MEPYRVLKRKTGRGTFSWDFVLVDPSGNILNRSAYEHTLEKRSEELQRAFDLGFIFGEEYEKRRAKRENQRT